jgi:hypothetical protein
VNVHPVQPVDVIVVPRKMLSLTSAPVVFGDLALKMRFRPGPPFAAINVLWVKTGLVMPPPNCSRPPLPGVFTKMLLLMVSVSPPS